MMRLITLPLGIAICLAAGCADPVQNLLGQAHGSAESLLHQTGVAAFDDSVAQVFPEQGLVCGSKVNVKAGSDEGYQRYYFSRSLGAVLEGSSPAWIPLANSCLAAIVQRAAAANRKLDGDTP